MCRPRSEGGQRCATHTRKALVKAKAVHAARRLPETYDEIQAARVQHGATRAGRRELEAELAATESSIIARDLRDALDGADQLQAQRRAAVEFSRERPGEPPYVPQRADAVPDGATVIVEGRPWTVEGRWVGGNDYGRKVGFWLKAEDSRSPQRDTALVPVTRMITARSTTAA